MNETRNCIALVGGNQRGLETLALLVEEGTHDSALIIEPDRGALVFHLKDYGFSFNESLHIELSQRISDLKGRTGVRQIIDASGNPNLHRDLYQLGAPVEISRDSVFQLNHSLKKIPAKTSEDFAKRQAYLLEHFKGPLGEIDLASDEEEFYRYLLDSTLLATNAEGAELFLLEEDEKRVFLAMARESGVAPKWHPPEVLLKGGKGVISHIARTGQPFLLPKGELSLWEQELLDGEEVTALIGIPIREDNQLLGVLFLYRGTDSAPFHEQDLDFLSKMSPQLIRPIKKLLTLKDIREASLTEALRKEVREIMDSKFPIQQKLQKSLGKITEGLSSLRGSVFVKDPYSDDLMLQATTHYSPQMIGLMRIRKGTGVIGQTAHFNHPFYLKQDPNAVLPPEQEMGTWPATLSLPISTSSEMVGVIHLEFDNLPRLPMKTLKLGKDLCDLLASAVASDVERHRMSQKVLKLTVVNEEGLELLSTNDRDKVLRFATGSAAMIMDAEAVVLRIADPGGKGLLVGSTYGLHRDEIDQELVNLDRLIASKVFETKNTLSIPNLEESEFPSPESFPYRSALSTVLFGNDQPIGTLTAYNKLMYNSFSCTSFHVDDMEILEKYANYVGKSLVQAQEFKSRQALITIDETTGLKNNRYLQLRLPEEVQRAERYQRNLTLIIMEVDDQQKAFQQLDRPARKDLVKQIAGIVRETFRNVDIIVRVEKIKFAILMPDTGERAYEAISRLSRNVSEVKLKSVDSGKVTPLVVRVGYSNFPEDAKEPDELFAKASQMRTLS
ncbi:MAG TPA: sensor domain-containing diguanylate cyclase [Nitrospiria bacterium]|jgi:diguanylate cyclase (GGDEF)-like protein